MDRASPAGRLPRWLVVAGLVVVIVIAVVASYQWLSGATSPAGCAQFPGDPCSGSLYYGASVEGGDPAPLESMLHRRLTLFRSYEQATTPASAFAERASADVGAGRIPLISTKVPGTWGDVADGKYDEWLIERIKALAAVDGPVWLAIHHEPQGDGSPSDWVLMQQHAHQLIEKYSSNIALVGILNGSSFQAGNGDPRAYYMPVGTGVDVMGFDAYNPWSPDNGLPWKSATQTLSPALTIQSWGYPVLVGEYGVRADPDRPERAARWLADAYRFGVAHGLVGMSYFDSSENSSDGSWALDGARLDQFAANLNSPETTSLDQ